jgi:hypothetical protein
MDKRSPRKRQPDWDSGVKLQLLHFRSLSIRKKVKIVEEMEGLARYMSERKKRRLSAA